LQLAFPRARMPRKKYRESAACGQLPALNNLFDVALLGRTEVVIEK